jgi:hypothetical protein
MERNKSPKITKKYFCEKCNYKCYRQSEFNRHLLTAKHKRNQMELIKSPKITKQYSCNCGKIYKVASGLWKHKQKCIQNINFIAVQENHEEKKSLMDIITQNKEIMDMLIVQNEELRKQNKEQSDTIKELIPKIGNNNITNTTNNNQFNLNVFLNEDCKDAINFSEFIENIKITFEDLEHQAQVGYINGVSKLFIENLRDLGTHKRPIHCTDKKRKTIYIKENNEWDKEGSQNTLEKGIREVSRKGLECLTKEKQENREEYKDIESEFSQKCLLIHRSILPSIPQETTISKVIEKITTETGVK